MLTVLDYCLFVLCIAACLHFIVFTVLDYCLFVLDCRLFGSSYCVSSDGLPTAEK